MGRKGSAWSTFAIVVDILFTLVILIFVIWMTVMDKKQKKTIQYLRSQVPASVNLYEPINCGEGLYEFPNEGMPDNFIRFTVQEDIKVDSVQDTSNWWSRFWGDPGTTIVRVSP